MHSDYYVDLFGFEIMSYIVQSGTLEDMVLENPENHLYEVIDDFLEYPMNKCIFCDDSTLQILLRCAPREVSEELFDIYMRAL